MLPMVVGRHNVSFKAVSGEGNVYTRKITALWEETTLPTNLSIYELEEIFNADDEFGLFFRTKQKNH